MCPGAIDTPTHGRMPVVAPLLLLAAGFSALFFNGERIAALAACIIFLTLWLTVVLQAVRSQGLRPGIPWLPLAMGAFLLWLIVSSLFSQVPYLSWLNVWWMGILPGVFLIAWLDPGRETTLQRALDVFTTMAVLLALYALWQHLARGEEPLGTFRTRNSLAALLTLPAFHLLGRLPSMPKPNARRWAAAAALYVLTTTIGVIQSRGAWLGFGIGFVLLLGLVCQRRAARRWLLPVGILVAATVTAYGLSLWRPVSGHDLLQRAVSLTDAPAAGYSRFVIWAPALRLFLQHPLTGTGPGTYFMVIPPWLDPADSSAHFYVHNDYLQVALETGLPGLLALMAVMFASLHLLLHGLRRFPRHHPQRLLLASAFSGVLAVAIHSFFTFNLYIVPTMLLAALFLARLHTLVSPAEPTGRHLLSLRPTIFRFLQATLVAGVAWHFGTLVAAQQALARGRALAAAADLERAHESLVLAQRLAPAMDNPWLTDADLLQRSARLLPDRPNLAADLLDRARKKATEALHRNPYRPQSHAVLARIHQQRQQPAQALAAWQRALDVDPRFLPARIALARGWLARHRPDRALAILRAGLPYRYRLNDGHLTDYMRLTERTARAQGQIPLADRLQDRIRQLETMREQHA